MTRPHDVEHHRTPPRPRTTPPQEDAMTTAPETARPAARPAAGPPVVPGPTAEQVTALQAVRAHPCVSVLLTTTPGPRMLPGDLARLHGLVARAAERLREEDPATGGTDLVAALGDLVAEAAAGPVSAAVALYAGGSTRAVVPLPLPVRDRVVVDPTFATRDLVRALHRAPRHAVLVLTGSQARLFEEVGGALAPAVSGRFPLTAPDQARGQRGSAAEEATRSFLRTVDRSLGAYLALRPAPLVLVGPERLLATFRATSKNLGRLAGSITGSHASAPLPVLRERIRPVLDAYLHSRQEEALAVLAQRAAADRVVSGLPSAWLAARHERPEVLAVEDGLHVAARLSADGDLLTPASDVEHPEVLDDVVDELIELVLHRGGWVALVEDGALREHGGVALAVRPPRS